MLRDNGGGYAAFFDLFMSTFFASNKTIGYCRYKMGFSRYDYTPWTTFRFKAYDGTSYEGCGIEPDISIPLNSTQDNRFTAAVN